VIDGSPSDYARDFARRIPAIHAPPISRILDEVMFGYLIVVLAIELRLWREMVKMESSPASKASKHDIFGTIDQQRINVHNRVFAPIGFSIFLLLKHCFTLPKRRTCTSKFMTDLTSCKVWCYAIFLPRMVDAAATLKHKITIANLSN